METSTMTFKPESFKPTINAEQGWEAVAQRDRSFDGELLYAVKTTGIYCRPSCPSRRPQRRNVEFYFGCEAAERAGYRACRRCHPREPQGAVAEVELARRICRHISENLEGDLRLSTLAAQLRMSPFHLQRTFKKVMGISPRQYAEARRMGVLKAALRFGAPVTDAIYQAGYGSSSRLYERSNGSLGMTPRTYKQGGAGMRIHYTIVESAMGRLLVAGTAQGISAVCLGEADSAMQRALGSEYPRAEIVQDDGELQQWVKQILKYLAGSLPDLNLPVDLRATAFQWRVWQELMKIPRGQTRSYSEVARLMGRPNATRAVARACATNPAALVIPCHRVVGKDGELHGYRWGLNRKKKLLEQEGLAST